MTNNSHWLFQTSKLTNVPWYLSPRISLFTAIEFRVPVCGPGCQIVSKCVPHSWLRAAGPGSGSDKGPRSLGHNTRSQSVTDLSSLWRPDNSQGDSQNEADTKWPGLVYLCYDCCACLKTLLGTTMLYLFCRLWIELLKYVHQNQMFLLTHCSVCRLKVKVSAKKYVF